MKTFHGGKIFPERKHFPVRWAVQSLFYVSSQMIRSEAVANAFGGVLLHMPPSFLKTFSKADRCRRLLCSSGGGSSSTSEATNHRQRLLLLLSLCSDSKRLYQTHGFMVRRCLDHNTLLLSRFIDACSALGLSEHGYLAFSHNFKDTTNPPADFIYLYNTMIKALSRQPQSAKEAIFLYNNIQLVSGLRPDSYSFPFALKAAVRLSSVQVGRQIHCQAVGTGLDSDVHVLTALIQMYASCGGGCVVDAQKLFDGMHIRDVASWNAIIAGYAKTGDIDAARHFFELMPDRNVISWTCVIAGYAQVDRPSDAISIFRRMQLEGVEPDEVAMVAVVSACASLGALGLGEWIHHYIDTHRMHKTVPLNNALIDMYAKSGNIGKATEVFENTRPKNVVTWTTIISGLALHGHGREALEMFARMERDQIQPNDVTFIAVLSACSHVGFVEMGRCYFKSMYSRYGVKPKIEHYGCMIDLLGRSGCLREAHGLVKAMPYEANRAIWGSLLAASRMKGDVELAELSLQHLIMVEPHNSGNYSLLSNTYAAIGQWNQSGMMRKVMRDSGVIKVPGGSSIEVNYTVHEFSAASRSHPESLRIHELLSQIIIQLKMAGKRHREPWGMLESEDGGSMP